MKNNLNLDELRRLEKTGEYLFHGSPDKDIQILEPRQAYTWINGEKTEDGDPGVAATPYLDIAIFRSLIQAGSQFSVDGDELSFSATKEAQEIAKNKVGYVYVLPRNFFKPKNGYPLAMDWRCEKNVKPINIVEVQYKDLPKNIKLLP